MYLVISTSLNSQSRSRIMAQHALSCFPKFDHEAKFIDLAAHEMPICDGDQAYGASAVGQLAQTIESAEGIIVASPIYNYDVSASCKNMIELTGKAWTEKVVGFLCAAGGQGSYMAPMQLANSLMLDFRTLVVPQFVYATGDKFQGDQIAEIPIEERILDLVGRVVRVSQALK